MAQRVLWSSGDRRASACSSSDQQAASSGQSKAQQQQPNCTNKTAGDFEVVVQAADEVPDAKDVEQQSQGNSHHSKGQSGAEAGQSSRSNAAGSAQQPARKRPNGSSKVQSSNNSKSMYSKPDDLDEDEQARPECGEAAYAAGSGASSEYSNPSFGKASADDQAPDEHDDPEKNKHIQTHEWEAQMELSVDGMVREELKWLKSDGYLAGHATFHEVRAQLYRLQCSLAGCS